VVGRTTKELASIEKGRTITLKKSANPWAISEGH
jgi:hypothetical protein